MKIHSPDHPIYLHLSLFVFTLVVMISCKSVDPFLSDNSLYEMQNHLNTQLDDWHEAAYEANAGAFFSQIADDGIYIGTDASEVWSKEEFQSFAMPYFEKGKAWSFKKISRNIYFSDNRRLVWFDELLDTWMGTCRGSGVLEWNDQLQQFKIRHYVLSLTVPNEIINDVIQIMK